MGRMVSLVALVFTVFVAGAANGWAANEGLPSSAEINERYHDDTAGRHPLPALLQKAMIGAYDPGFFATDLPQYSRTTGKVAERVRSVRNVRKAGVLATAFVVSNTLSREEIANWYINTLYWGRSCYRPNDAADVYFGKSVDDLSLSEIAYLVGIVIAPSTFDPDRYPDRANERRNSTLDQLAKTGSFSAGELSLAAREELEFQHPLGKCERPRDR